MQHKVKIPSPLQSYTQGASEVSVAGNTLREVLAELDHRYNGIRFRMIDEQERVRPHIRIFVNNQEIPAIDTTLLAGDEVHLICALSGG